MTSPLDSHQQHLVMHSQGVETSDLRVGMILPGDNVPLSAQGVLFILAHRAAEQATRSGKPAALPRPTATEPAPQDAAPQDTGPYGPDPALGNTGDQPTAGALFLPQLGSAYLNKQRLVALLAACTEAGGPYRAGEAPAGLGWQLDADEAAYLNTRFGYGV